MTADRDLFDIWLSSRLKAVRTRAGIAAAPPALQRSSRGRTVVARVTGLAIATVAGVGLVTTALLTHHVAPTAGTPATASYVPWRDLPASEPVSPVTVPGVRPCSLETLDITFPYVANEGGAADSSTWPVRVRNIGKQICFVAPTLVITFVTPSGPMHLAPSPQIQAGRDIIYLSSSLAAGPSPYPSAVDGEIGTTGNCTIPAGTRMSIDLGPSLGSVTLNPGPGLSVGTPCPPGTSPSDGYYAELFVSSTSCCSVIDPSITPSTNTQRPLISPNLDAPSLVHPGDRVRYLVTVADAYIVGHSAGPIAPPPPLTLSPCPTYQEELEGSTGSAAAYRLNCADAKPIRSGSTETFEMYLTVPTTAPQGPAILVWTLDTPLGRAVGRHYLEIADRTAPKSPYVAPPSPTACVPHATPPSEPINHANQGGPFGSGSNFSAISSWIGTTAAGGPTYGVWTGRTGVVSPTPGIAAVAVYRFTLAGDGCAFGPVLIGIFTEPAANGPLSIDSISGGWLYLSTPHGQRWFFALSSDHFSSSAP